GIAQADAGGERQQHEQDQEPGARRQACGGRCRHGREGARPRVGESSEAAGLRHRSDVAARSLCRPRELGMRLLGVEDNPSLVANLFDYFEARGHLLDAAPDGPTGCHLASTQAYDAVVLDWMLPRLDGREVLRRLREAGHDVPVLMLTARDELPDKIAGFRA